MDTLSVLKLLGYINESACLIIKKTVFFGWMSG